MCISEFKILNVKIPVPKRIRLPAGHVPRTFARRHFVVELFEPTRQKRLSVIMLPCKVGTDLFH
jgi:hypothetical protein